MFNKETKKTKETKKSKKSKKSKISINYGGMREILPRNMVHGKKYYSQYRLELGRGDQPGGPTKSGRRLGVFDKLRHGDPNQAIFNNYRNIRKEDGTMGESGLGESYYSDVFHTKDFIFYEKNALDNTNNKYNRTFRDVVNGKTKSSMANIMEDWLSYTDSGLEAIDEDNESKYIKNHEIYDPYNYRVKQEEYEALKLETEKKAELKINKKKNCPKGTRRNKLGECEEIKSKPQGRR
jgi:hypothetical protein